MIHHLVRDFFNQIFLLPGNMSIGYNLFELIGNYYRSKKNKILVIGKIVLKYEFNGIFEHEKRSK